jgi:hypothetical protein
MARELLRGEGKLATGKLLRPVSIGIVVSVDHKLSFDLDRFVGIIVEVESTAESAGRTFAELRQHVGRPDGDQSQRDLLLLLSHFVLLLPRPCLRPFGAPACLQRLAAGQSDQTEQR